MGFFSVSIPSKYGLPMELMEGQEFQRKKEEQELEWQSLLGQRALTFKKATLVLLDLS